MKTFVENSTSSISTRRRCKTTAHYRTTVPISVCDKHIIRYHEINSLSSQRQYYNKNIIRKWCLNSRERASAISYHRTFYADDAKKRGQFRLYTEPGHFISKSLRTELKHPWNEWLRETDSKIGRRKTKILQLCYLTGSKQLLSGHDFLHFCFLGCLSWCMEDKPITTMPEVIVRDYLYVLCSKF